MIALRLLRNLFGSSARAFVSSDLPPWEHRAPPDARSRLRVLWTGTQTAPVPILVREPTSFDPTR